MLFTSGCSFSRDLIDIDGNVQYSWTTLLQQYLTDFESYNYALGSQGNGLISRGTIYNIQNILKTTNPENLIVGIMWSGKDRHDYYCQDNQQLDFVIKNINNHWMRNPTEFVNDDNEPNWVILNHHWADQGNYLAELYYKYFHSQVGAAIYTIEHILRVQWFLKLHNIKYFMTSHHDLALYNVDNNHPDVKYLWDEVDWNMFLPVRNEWDWLKQNVDSNLDSRIGTINPHPTTEMNQRFTHEVIIPHLKNKQFI